ncbi:helicase-related protein [Neomoorella humiferrea]|uniref:UvrABC system protein B n=1 Tax=Neomoorella humiferrea TaxID=676965 RepID=A0A2T0ASF0_9FIRM|nr:helicase-related protein [Moorella humiferrea]PRR73130.1 UvrABC system protein B [Moorella humiferrea]
MLLSYAPRFCWRGFVYLVWGDRGLKVGLSHKPGLDHAFWLRKGYRHFALLTPPLPLGTAFFLQEYLRRHLSGSAGPSFTVVRNLLNKARARLGLPPGPFTVTPFPEALPAPPPLELALVRKILSGRILWLEEIEEALAESKMGVTTPLEDILHWLYLAGQAEVIPGVGYGDDGEPRCRRCGQTTRLLTVACAACGSSDCLICEKCLTMGQSRRCRPLYARPAEERRLEVKALRQVEPRLKYELSPAQRDAYQEAAEFVLKGRDKECLLWAACGAGKTEVACGPIAAALGLGKTVLYACPRREVVRELQVRLRSFWPELEVLALYGGSTGKYGRADITLATTHQALRFYRRFDLVILDEVDAFPLSEDPMLYYAVERARREDGQILFMTATPPPALVARAKGRRIKVIYLPARHHGRPLPEPEVLRDPFLAPPGAGPLPRLLIACLEQTMAERARLLIFVPAVRLVDEVVTWLLRERSGEETCRVWVRGVTASHPQRDEVIDAFRRGDFPVLVATTVMERGITIPRLNVLVLYADEERVFTENALIQMAGRAGRAASYPKGRVWFLARRVSPAMAAARYRIREFNSMARRRGYLVEGKE